MSLRIAFLGRVVAVLVITLLSAPIARADEQTALDRYVAAPDPAYGYTLVDTIKGAGQTTYVLELTSQKWLTEKEVDRPVWKHWLTIVRPDEVKSSKALMMIAGGANDRPAPKAAPIALSLAAANTGSVTAEVRMIPNQPLTFTGDKPRVVV